MTDRTELRSWLGGMQSLAELEGICDGSASVRSMVARVLPMLDRLDAAEAALARVRELHYPADNDPARTPVCEDCRGKAGTHPCGCWADVDREPVCGHCSQGHKGLSVAWPCPTIAAIEGDDYPEPACLIHDVDGEDVRGWEAAECTCPTTTEVK